MARRLAIAVLGPLRFGLETGYVRSALRGRAELSNGQPLPWLTYPAIDFLSGLDLAGKRILEWGSGQSTLWWAARHVRLLSIERDPGWYREVRTRLGDAPHVEYRLVKDEGEYARSPEGGRFDLVVIDGASRTQCAEVALRLVEPSGAVVLDNSQSHWSTPHHYPIIDLFNAAGFLRADFHGFAPGVWKQQCTSVFFRPDTALLRNLPPPRPKYRQPTEGILQ